MVKETYYRMSVIATLFAPLALLMPAPVAAEPVSGARGDLGAQNSGDLSIWEQITESFRIPSQNQVRIEQRMTIRISPRPSVLPNMLMDLPVGEVGPRFTERRMGQCFAVSGIAGVQSGGRSTLILFMRDQRMISVALERACLARDFYSGFYVERNADGQICVDRDTLLSRSGANCKLTRIRQLIEADD
jgi:hypothetical protein